jgi:WD repeat-containing protein 70
MQTSLRNKLEQGSRPKVSYHDDDEDDVDRPTVIDAAELTAAGGDEDDNNKDDHNDIPAELRAHFPTSFGAPQRKKQQNNPSAAALKKNIRNDDNDEHEEDQLDIGPPVPAYNEEDDNDKAPGPSSSYRDTSFKDSNPWKLPISSEVVLEPHSKAVVALALDHSGSRLVTGSHDYTVKLFDFNGMKSDCRPFRSFEPTEGHPIVALSWSPSGDAIFVVTGSPSPKVYDRDGKEQGELPRGDMYIRDMKNTKGHVTACSGGAWHPIDKGTGLTSSEDGTLRVWDLWQLEQKTVIKPTLTRPGRVSVTCCGWSPEGKLIGGGLIDGTLQIWDVRGKFGQSAAVGAVLAPKQQGVKQQNWSFVSQAGNLLRNAHESSSEITCLQFSVDGTSLLTRGADETLKLWDVRKFKTPIASVSGLPTLFSNTQCCFSPDEKLVLTGISPATKESTSGAVAIFNKNDLTLVKKLGVPGSAVAVTWHSKINQIVVGCGDRKEGTTRVLYDNLLSTRGAMLSVGRRPRVDNAADYTADFAPQIYNPNALPLYREAWPDGSGKAGGGGGGGKRKGIPVDASIRTTKSFKPDIGSAGVAKGAGGKLGSTGGTLLTQYIMKNQGNLKNPQEEDVRASILRHHGKEDEMSRFTAAYAETQPKRIYAEAEEEEEEDDDVGPQPPPAAQ